MPKKSDSGVCVHNQYTVVGMAKSKLFSVVEVHNQSLQHNCTVHLLCTPHPTGQSRWLNCVTHMACAVHLHMYRQYPLIPHRPLHPLQDSAGIWLSRCSLLSTRPTVQFSCSVVSDSLRLHGPQHKTYKWICKLCGHPSQISLVSLHLRGDSPCFAYNYLCTSLFPLLANHNKTVLFVHHFHRTSYSVSLLLISVALNPNEQQRNRGWMTVWLNGVTGCYLTISKMCLEMDTEIGSSWWWATLLCSWSCEQFPGRHRRNIYQVIGRYKKM